MHTEEGLTACRRKGNGQVGNKVTKADSGEYVYYLVSVLRGLCDDLDSADFKLKESDSCDMSSTGKVYRFELREFKPMSNVDERVAETRLVEFFLATRSG